MPKCKHCRTNCRKSNAHCTSCSYVSCKGNWKEIPDLLQKTEDHYLSHKSSSLVITMQMNLVRASIPYLFKVRFNIILQSPSRSTSRAFSLRFSHLNRVCFPTYVPHARPVSSSFLLVTRIIVGEQYKSWNYPLRNFHQSHFNPTVLGLHIFLITLFSAPSAYVPPSLWETKFHTHTKPQVKLLIVYLNFCIFR